MQILAIDLVTLCAHRRAKLRRKLSTKQMYVTDREDDTAPRRDPFNNHWQDHKQRARVCNVGAQSLALLRALCLVFICVRFFFKISPSRRRNTDQNIKRMHGRKISFVTRSCVVCARAENYTSVCRTAQHCAPRILYTIYLIERTFI